MCKKQARSLPSRAPNWSSTTPLRSLSVIDIVPPRNTSSRRFFPAGPAPSGTAVACCFGFAAGGTCCRPVGIGEAALFGADFEGAGLGWACVAANSVLGKHTGRTATTRARTVGSPSRTRRVPLIRDISHVHAFLQPGCARPREAQSRSHPTQQPTLTREQRVDNLIVWSRRLSGLALNAPHRAPGNLSCNGPAAATKQELMRAASL